jgi:hypothetical protein
MTRFIKFIDQSEFPPPSCPWCNTARHVQEGSMQKTFYCRNCWREFEAGEDGDVGYGRPDRRLIRQENGSKKKNGNTQPGKRPHYARHR